MNNETNEIDENSRLDWHSGFEGSFLLSMRRYIYDLSIEREHCLSREPLRIDFLLVKKNKEVVVDNSIGRHFRKHNIIEFKNPEDKLNIDVIWKTVAYAALYKSMGNRADEIKISDITVTIFRAIRPRKLFKGLAFDGKEINEICPGVYSIKGMVEIPVYVVVMNELQDKELAAISILSKGAKEEDVRHFLKEVSSFTEPEDKRNADAVLQISAKTNKELYQKLRGDDSMCEALRELMADDLKEAESKGIEKGIEKRDIQKITEMLRDGKTAEAIADFCKYPLEQVKKVQEEILMKQ